MNYTDNKQKTLELFAVLIDYPESKDDIEHQFDALIGLLPENKSYRLRQLKIWLNKQSLGYIQEAYTAIFDINSLCSPYVGYYLFGEDYRRSLLITGLKEKFRQFGFKQQGNEMPDHISVLLKFLSNLKDSSFYCEIINEALIPSVDKMLLEVSRTNTEIGNEKSSDMSAIDFYASIITFLKIFIKSEVINAQ